MEFVLRVIHPSIRTRPGFTLDNCPHPPDDFVLVPIMGVSWVRCGWCGAHAMVER